MGLALCLACHVAPATTQEAPARPPLRTRVPHARLPGLGDYRYWSGVNDSLRVVVTDSATWRRLWDRIQRGASPAAPLPEIDFRRESLILTALGARGSTGYGIAVDSVLRSGARVDSAVVVHVTKWRPVAGAAVGAVMTAPLDVVRIPRPAGPLRFIEQWREGSGFQE